MGKKFGYARVSKIEQDLQLQLHQLKKQGCEYIYQDKMTGTSLKRPALEELLSDIKKGKIGKGDSIVVYKLDRISRSTKHLLELIELFEDNQIEFISLKDKLDTSTPTGRFMFKIFASVAEMERDIISERTKDSLAAKKASGIVLGRPRADMKKIELAIELYGTNKYTLSEIKELTGIAKATFYKYLKMKQ